MELLYALIGLVALYFVIKLLKWPIKILINGIAGVILLYLANFLMASMGASFSLIINPITALIAGFFGIPGVIVLIIIGVFL